MSHFSNYKIKLILPVVEVGRDSDDSVGDIFAEVGFGGLLHFDQDHGGDFFRGENLGISPIIDLYFWLSSLIDDLKIKIKKHAKFRNL